ncbi:LCP family protein [Paraclostridium sordellii]|uniref:LCP family protein n=1 Tax=Paraclostridium sordellii TaxID=1505 RepID=UPI0005E59E5A|nr:LCP family protein [Paeniclostridium sordellii]CEP81250.1 LytR family transcriptional regulator [[Clostridium] sordellii] [Paeniclostridium sordellii]
MFKLKQLLFLILIYYIFNLNTTNSYSLDTKAQYIDGINNLLIIGVDSSSNSNSKLYCSIVLTIDSVNKSLKITSICKDSLVNIANIGYGKLSNSYINGKEYILIETIKNNFTLKIDNYVVINKVALIKIIDSINGIDFEDSHVNGQETVNLLYKYSNKNIFLQEEIQRKILQEILYSFSKLDFIYYPRVIYHTFPYIKINITPSKMLNLGFTALSFNNYTAKQLQFPLIEYSSYISLYNNFFLGWDRRINLLELNKFIYNK